MNAAGAPLLGVAPGAVTLTAQVTCLLLLALALAWLGRRGSPRTLHLLWTTTFALVLALPLLGSLGPSWEVPLLPAAAGEPPPAASPAFDDPPIEDAGAAPSSDAAHMREALVRAAQARLDAQSDAARGASADAPPRHASVRIAWIIWIVGCGLSLVPLAFGALRLRRLVRTARPLRDPEWVRQAEALRCRLGLRAGVRLLSSAAVATPLTGGLRSPVILLPESASSWSDERRAVVLSHELVHVRRHDALRKIMRRAACALYWFHPLVWATERLAALAGEKACDEEVVALGVRPSEYARHLLFLAATGPLARFEGAGAGARSHFATGEKDRVHTRTRASTPEPRTHRPDAHGHRGGGSVGRRRAAGTDRQRGCRCGGRVPRCGPRRGADRGRRQGPPWWWRRAAGRRPRARWTTWSASPPPTIRSGRSPSVRTAAWSRSGSGRTVVSRSSDPSPTCCSACGRRGDVGLNAEGTAVQTLGEDSWLVVESRGERTHRLAVARGAGRDRTRMERRWRPTTPRRGGWQVARTHVHGHARILGGVALLRRRPGAVRPDLRLPRRALQADFPPCGPESCRRRATNSNTISPDGRRASLE